MVKNGTVASASPGVEPGWLTALRGSARERFDAMAWPTPQDEEWRRTDITAFDFSGYRLPAAGAAPGSAPVAAPIPQGLSGVMRFRGGTLTEAGLRPDLAGRGVHFASLVGSHNGAGGRLESLLRAGFERADNRVVAWHYQHITHGALLHVPQFVEIEEPFLIEVAEEGEGILSMPHVAVILDAGARAVVATRILSGPSDRLLCNAGLEIAVGDAAKLGYFEEQSLSGTSTFFSNGTATVGRDAELLHFVASLGGALAKTRLDCSMTGLGGTANLNGVYFAAGKQHMDLRTVQHHRAGSSYSRSHYKGAVRDAARTVYQGLIEVMRTAPKTDAYLTNRNLILNDGARADSIPSLRINQDDVRCSHGSTTGRIDPAQLFYLETRGFSPREAAQMLVTAYFQELVDQMPEFVGSRFSQCWKPGPNGMGVWKRVGDESLLADSEIAAVVCDGRRFALFRLDDGVYALDDVCSHEFSLLSEGEVWNGEVSCPKHGSRFNIRTGAVKGLPATLPVRAYPARVEEGGIYVELDG